VDQVAVVVKVVLGLFGMAEQVLLDKGLEVATAQTVLITVGWAPAAVAAQVEQAKQAMLSQIKQKVDKAGLVAQVYRLISVAQ
jgi:hypothetical protein